MKNPGFAMKLFVAWAQVGKDAWKKEVGYHGRSLIETAVCGYKTRIGNPMRARELDRQKGEVRRGCHVLNACARLGMPDA